MKNRLTYKIATIAVLLALFVVTLGAYTRLTNAGLGCPDWPGCYGHMIVPGTQAKITEAQLAYPSTPLEEGKAWTEMAHRYAAGALGVLILVVAGIALARRKEDRHPIALPLLLVVMLFFQAALGMWTVTWQLLPIVVMGHLLGGLTILACLWWLRLKLNDSYKYSASVRTGQFKPWAMLGLIIVFLQIALGGWVSANYAGLACVGFPFCNGQLLPHLNFHEAFNVLQPIGINYQGGVMDSTARVTIQMVHRIGAIITVVYIGLLALWLTFSAKSKPLRAIATIILLLLAAQFSLGVLNVTKLLPLGVAVAHNGVAALLLLALVTLNYRLRVKPKEQEFHI